MKMQSLLRPRFIFSLLVVFQARLFTAKAAMLEEPLQATEPLTVSVTLPVTVPLQVPAGKSFIDASVEFCEKNGLPLESAGQLARALQGKWEDMQEASRKVLLQCQQWKADYDVVPLKSWGTLPQNLRQSWMQADCDGLVAGDPLPPIASLTVAIGENQATLQLAKGESIEGAVRRFCSTHGVDLAENGPMLEQALSARLQDTIREEQGAGRVEEDEKEKTFLFSIPISINGTEVKLSVHEGDKLEPLVTNFCETHSISYDRYGTMLKEEIIRALTQLQAHLLDKAENEEPMEQSRPEQSDPRSKLFSFPLTVNGEDAVIDIYDGDELQARVSDFCRDHGIDAAAHGQTLVEAVMQKVRMLQQQGSSLLRVEGA